MTPADVLTCRWCGPFDCQQIREDTRGLRDQRLVAVFAIYQVKTRVTDQAVRQE